MNSLEPGQNFEAARRQHLIDATIEALADVGFKATSLSQIARRADVSTGLFAHYFGDKDGLLEATLRFMAARLVRAARRRLRDARSPRERLYAVPDSALADEEFERRTSAVWLAFWGQITHSTRYQRIQFIYQRRMISNLRHDLRALVPADCVDSYATMIASMIDGVWIRSHASPLQADAAGARAIVRALIDGLIGGVAAGPATTGMSGVPDMPVRLSKPASEPCVVQITSPATGEALGAHTPARRGDIERAVAEARRGLAAWQRMPGGARASALRRCAEAIRAQSQELARLCALGTGRAVAQTVEVELPRAAQAFERWASLASRPASERIDLGAGRFGYTRREPIGVVAALGHWGAPLFDPCRQVAPALACGNALIFQPDPQASRAADYLSEIVMRAGVPAGVFTVLAGDADTTRLLLDDTDDIRGPLSDARPQSATIVFDDADMDQAARVVLQGWRRWAPTPDFSESRLFVQERGLSAFRARLRVHAKTLRVGDPLDPRTQIGALISPAHLRHVLALIDQAVEHGARLRMGGRGVGNVLAPTILDGCRDDMPITAPGLFAPVLPLVAFGGDTEVGQMIARMGLPASVGLFSTDVARVHRVANKLRASFCCINDSSFSVTDDGESGFDWCVDGTQVAKFYSRSRRVFCQNDGCPDE